MSLCAGCRPAGTASSSPDEPHRVISIAPSLTAIVARLGASDRLVGVSTFCRLPNGHDLPRVGGYLDPDVETIVSLHPDMVLTAPNPMLEKAMASFSIPLRVFHAQWSTLADIRTTILDVADTLNLRLRGRELVQQLDTDLAALRTRAAGLSKTRVLLVIERQTGSMIVAGARTHLTELIELCGGENVVKEGSRYPHLDIETVVALAPEVIIDVSLERHTIDPEAEASGQGVWAAYTSIPAVRRRRIHVVDGSRIVQPGPDIAESAALLFQLIHEAP